MRKILATALAAALIAAGSAAFAEAPRTMAVTVEATQVRAGASATAKVVSELDAGVPLRIVTLGTKPVKVGSRSAPFHEAVLVDGTKGWVFGAALNIPKAPLSYADLGDADLWMDYLELALRPGERVVAVEDYGGVSAGMEGWWFATPIDRDYEDAFLVVWDDFLDASIYSEYVPDDFPRLLTARSWWVPGASIALAGETATADFPALETAYVSTESGERLAPVGSRVVLGKHTKVDPKDESSLFWADGMDAYVGEETVITEHVGRDKWGYAIAYVEADDGAFYWRVADMYLVERYIDEGDGGSMSGETDFDGEYDAGAEYAEESAGMIKVGSMVVLGKHDDGGGEFSANWSDDMDKFVGKRAKVTEFVGADSDGFLVVAVEGNDFVWRVRNLTLFGRGRPGSYGFKVGDRVLVGKHRPLGESELVFWVEDMEEFVGREATIAELVGPVEDELSGSFYVRLDVDEGQWYWRVETLSPVE